MSRPPAHPGYDPARYAELFRVEDRHFWFRGRNRAIAAVVGPLVAGLRPGYRVLEVGCGTGNVLRVLADTCRAGTVTGMDVYAEGLGYARRRSGCALVQGDMLRPPFGVRFDLIGLFDVLEHLEDDGAVLRTLRAMLAPGGRLLLTVPAHPRLWSYFDEYSRHRRRYRRAELRDKIEAAGLAVERLSYALAVTLPGQWLGRALAGRRAADSAALAARDLRLVPGVNEVLAALLGLESRWLAAGQTLPFGTSLLAVATLPEG